MDSTARPKDWFIKIKRRDEPVTKKTPNKTVKVAVKTMDDFLALPEPSPLGDIHQYLESSQKEREADVCRASSAPRCVRQRWFLAKGRAPKPLDWRALSVFMTGDLVELKMVNAIVSGCVGPDKFYAEVDFGKRAGSVFLNGRDYATFAQETLEIDAGNGLKISGHADGWGKRNHDGQWELIEIKSSSNRGFRDFEKGIVPNYEKQAATLLQSSKAKKLGATECRFFYERKETSHIADMLICPSEELIEEVMSEFHQSISNDMPDIPERLLVDDGEPLNWECSYCPFVDTCRSDYSISFQGNTKKKPVYLKEGDE